jgi:hypothetical protein
MAVDTAIVPAPDATDSENGTPVTGETLTPLDRLIENERTITKGLKAFEATSLKLDETKESVGEALYEIYTEALWKARKGKDGKNLYKNFGEYLEAKGWTKTASRAYQLMADHRKALKAANAPVVEAKRGPKANNPGRSAQTFANMLNNYRTSLAQRAEAMTGGTQAEGTFIDIAERFAEVAGTFIAEFEALADSEKGSETVATEDAK